MSLIACREKFQTGQISKQNYIDSMFNLHANLFEYSQFIKNTDISHIEIHEDFLIFILKNLNIKLQCHVLDKRITPIEILNFNTYEKQDADIFLSFFKKDMVFFDIGSHVGFYSIIAAKKNPNIKIYSFEPIPDTFNILKKNILLNQLDNIHPFNMGLLDEDKDLNFFLNPTLSANASAQNVSDATNINKVLVKVTTLDDFFKQQKISALDIVKCDVEGAELLVFQGGIQTIIKYKPIIFTEMLRKWSKKFNYHPNDIINLFHDCGYQCYTSQNDKLVKFLKMDDATLATNFFFLHGDKHQEHIRRLLVD